MPSHPYLFPQRRLEQALLETNNMMEYEPSRPHVLESPFMCCCGGVLPFIAVAFFTLMLTFAVREYRAAHGEHEYECAGTLYVSRFLGLCSDYRVAGEVGDHHGPDRYYCFGPINEVDLRGYTHSDKWTCYGRTPLPDLGPWSVVVVSRANDGLWFILLMVGLITVFLSIGATTCYRLRCRILPR